MQRVLQLSLLLIATIATSSAFCQTCCTAGMPVSSVLEIPNAERSLFFNARIEHRSINRLVDNNQILRNDPRSRSGQNLSLKADYIHNKFLAFSAIVPLIRQSRATQSEQQQSIGLGDLVAMSQFTYNEFNLGVAFPGRRFGFGNELNVRWALDYTFITKSLFLNPSIGLNYRTTQPNIEQFTTAPNSGGHWLSIPLGIGITNDGIKSVSVISEIPFYQKLNGLQITTDYVVGINFSYKFSLHDQSNFEDEILNNSNSIPIKLQQ